MKCSFALPASHKKKGAAWYSDQAAPSEYWRYRRVRGVVVAVPVSAIAVAVLVPVIGVPVTVPVGSAFGVGVPPDPLGRWKAVLSILESCDRVASLPGWNVPSA